MNYYESKERTELKSDNAKSTVIYYSQSNVDVLVLRNRCERESGTRTCVGKKGTDKFAKIWLEPQIELADYGSLTDTQARQVLSIAEKHWNMLLEFVAGSEVKLIKIKK